MGSGFGPGVGRDACYAEPSPGFVECTTCSNYPFVSHLNTQQLTCSVPHSGPPHAASGGVFKNAAVSTLRHEQRLMTTGEITKYVVLEGRFVSNSLPWTTFTSPHTTWPRRARQRAGIHTARAARPADRGNAETNVEHQCVCKSSNASRDHSRDASGPGRGLPDRVDTRHARFLLRRVRTIATRVPRETRVSTAPEATHRTAHPPKRAVPFRPTKPKALTDTYFPSSFSLRTAVRMGYLVNLPGKTPEATMASVLYTDIKKWKAGVPGSVFCRYVGFEPDAATSHGRERSQYQERRAPSRLRDKNRAGKFPTRTSRNNRSWRSCGKPVVGFGKREMIASDTWRSKVVVLKRRGERGNFSVSGDLFVSSTNQTTHLPTLRSRLFQNPLDPRKACSACGSGLRTRICLHYWRAKRMTLSSDRGTSGAFGKVRPRAFPKSSQTHRLPPLFERTTRDVRSVSSTRDVCSTNATATHSTNALWRPDYSDPNPPYNTHPTSPNTGR